MDFSWINLTNPVALWWLFLFFASLINIVLWSWVRLYRYKHSSLTKFKFWEFKKENLIWFSALYVFGCAYRSFFVKADVQRICVFDTWFSSVFLGRSIATIAELAFVIQWAIVLSELGKLTNDKKVVSLSKLIVPLILIAECFSWYAVITTNYLGNSIEESTWAITYSIILFLLFKLKKNFKGAFHYAIVLSLFFNFLYILFMIFVDVPMYINRYLDGLRTYKSHLGLSQGIIDLNTRWVVTHNIQDWQTEIPWMTLYFSFAVLVSIGLCIVPLNRERLSKHLH
jgi:hypothetical protein